MNRTRSDSCPEKDRGHPARRRAEGDQVEPAVHFGDPPARDARSSPGPTPARASHPAGQSPGAPVRLVSPRTGFLPVRSGKAFDLSLAATLCSAQQPSTSGSPWPSAPDHHIVPGIR